jgi:hypothetical protein
MKRLSIISTIGFVALMASSMPMFGMAGGQPRVSFAERMYNKLFNKTDRLADNLIDGVTNQGINDVLYATGFAKDKDQKKLDALRKTKNQELKDANNNNKGRNARAVLRAWDSNGDKDKGRKLKKLEEKVKENKEQRMFSVEDGTFFKRALCILAVAILGYGYYNSAE